MKISIAYSGNRRAFRGIFLSILSTLQHYSGELTYYIITADIRKVDPSFLPISAKQIALIQQTIAEVNPLSRVTLYDVTAEYQSTLMHGKNARSEYTPYTLFRLYLDVLLPETVEKIIYLDYDTMVCRSIEELFSLDIENYEFAAALDYLGRFWMGPTYTNNGVLLLNMKKIRETRLFEKARSIIQKKWFKMPDQSSIQMYVRNKLIIDEKFNEQRKIKPDTVVRHFNKGIAYFPYFHIYNYKQWQTDIMHDKFKIFIFDEVYRQYDRLMAENHFTPEGFPIE